MKVNEKILSWSEGCFSKWFQHILIGTIIFFFQRKSQMIMDERKSACISLTDE